MSGRAPRPFVIKRDGTLLDRATETILGRVWLVSGAGDDSGWYAENHQTRFGPSYTRHWVARQAWQDWRPLANHVTTRNPNGSVRQCDSRALHEPHEWQAEFGAYFDVYCPGNDGTKP